MSSKNKLQMPGAGLALVIPSGQSLVADYYSAASRGSAFGALYLTSALGGMGGSIVATNLGGSWQPFYHERSGRFLLSTAVHTLCRAIGG